VLVGGCCHEYEVALLRDDEQKILLREVERSRRIYDTSAKPPSNSLLTRTPEGHR
jgi:hypothetical protein